MFLEETPNSWVYDDGSRYVHVYIIKLGKKRRSGYVVRVREDLGVYEKNRDFFARTKVDALNLAKSIKREYKP